MTKLCLALDIRVPDLILLQNLKPHIDLIKVGPIAFYSSPDIVNWLCAHEFDIFLNLKLHDIPHTVAESIKILRQFHPQPQLQYLSVHAAGGLAMLKAAVQATPTLKILAVTDLSSIEIDDCMLNYQEAVKAQVHGIVSSDSVTLQDAAARKLFTVKPGIRLDPYNHHDHIRTMNHTTAAKLGVSCIVIGRPILEAEDPIKMCIKLKEELR